ncbi:MAG: dTDP-4-dehydrorhamnose 3,5-epimerase [Pelagibacteraceae bacterium]|nr:dTDP-4-dehydrorhamnose 3,5-epimerase [Pelagibacteraceae bacterium]|tara:strand:+ start:12024 stop:12560 length:537 start_codon:yes stop_codon:yes gene_type:complete
MKIYKTKLKDLLIIKQKNNIDRRGSLREIFNKKVFGSNKFVFEYCTTSKKNALRGFHFQKKFQQAKYVSVLKGKILDVVVDLRKNSKTFGKCFKIILSDKNATSLFIPEGFGHAYYSFDKINIVYYKLSNYYKPKFEGGINVNDRHINIRWPKKNFTLSKKDRKLKSFTEFCKSQKSL